MQTITGIRKRMGVLPVPYLINNRQRADSDLTVIITSLLKIVTLTIMYRKKGIY